MEQLRRLIGSAIAAFLVVSSLAACTPGIAWAWRLNADGTVSIAFCDTVRAEKLEAEYFIDGEPIAMNSGGGVESEFGRGRPTTLGPASWLRAAPAIDDVEWDSVEVWLYGDPEPYGDSGGYGRADRLRPVGGGQIERAELRLGEWVWNTGFNTTGPSCEVDETRPEPEESANYTMDDPQFEGILALYSAHDGGVALVNALADAESPSQLIAFQNRVISDLSVRAVRQVEPLHDGLSALYGAEVGEDLLLAAPAAASLLGYVWHPDAVPLNDWARAQFPEAAVFATVGNQ